MPSQPHDLIDPLRTVSDALDALTAGLSSPIHRPESNKSGHDGPGGPQLRGTAHGPYCAIRLGYIIAFADAIRTVLNLHSPRKASDPGVPSRCRHDNNTWPCKTYVAITSTLNSVLGNVVELNASAQQFNEPIVDLVRSSPAPTSREHLDHHVCERPHPCGRYLQGRRLRSGGMGSTRVETGGN